jgi:hypothetical protein
VNSHIVGVVMYALVFGAVALFFCWLLISVAGTVVEFFGFLSRTLRESYRERAEERKRVREAEKWGMRE